MREIGLKLRNFLAMRPIFSESYQTLVNIGYPLHNPQDNHVTKRSLIYSTKWGNGKGRVKGGGGYAMQGSIGAKRKPLEDLNTCSD